MRKTLMVATGVLALTLGSSLAMAQPSQENCENMLRVFDQHLEEVSQWDAAATPNPYVAFAQERREEAAQMCEEGQTEAAIDEIQQGISMLSHARPLRTGAAR
ncbi:MAG: hypothetical protein GVY13_00200 [Alphaproteobacteria bacterium]|jgi:hypothetical protein|nr:hypothetical protein [Alphaproteobacteria bacterium]